MFWVILKHFRISNRLQHIAQTDSFCHHLLMCVLGNPKSFFGCLQPDLIERNSLLTLHSNFILPQKQNGLDFSSPLVLIPKTTYSLPPLPMQYHRPWRAPGIWKKYIP